MSTLWLRHAPASAAVARHQVLAAFGQAGAAGEPAQDAALIASELVGNAVRHAAPLPSGRLAVRWSVGPHGYWISVTDGGTPDTGIPGADSPDGDNPVSRIAPRPAGSQDPTGRGLRIVAALADSWGVAAADGATTVWARTGTQRAS